MMVGGYIPLVGALTALLSRIVPLAAVIFFPEGNMEKRDLICLAILFVPRAALETLGLGIVFLPVDVVVTLVDKVVERLDRQD